MFPYSNPEFQLDLYRQRSNELQRTAAEYHLARSVRSAGRRARRGRHTGTAHHDPTSTPSMS